MKRIIDGRTYNTETATLLGGFANSNRRDFHYYSEDLYRNAKGAYFLHGVGGPASKYSRGVGQNEWAGDERIVPMALDDAKKWAEEHLDAGEYDKAFGEPEEAAPGDLSTRSRVNVVLDTGLYAALKAHSASTGTPVSRLLDKAIRETYDL